MALRILLAGQEAAGAQILRSLLSSEHDVFAVLTQEPRTKGGPSSLAALAAEAGVRTLPASLVKDPGFAATISEAAVDVFLNVHSLHLVADEVLAAPRIGSFNLHPGPLPEYAGLNTIGWAIYNGETEYGVTVHWMAPSIDAGPIAFEDRFPIDPEATALTLSAECTRRGLTLLNRVLERAGSDPRSIPAVEQELARRVYYSRSRIPQEGRVDWSLKGEDIMRFARAFDYGPFACPWGRPFMEWGRQRVEVVGLEATGQPSDEPPGTPRVDEHGGVAIACADQWISVGRLLVDGGALSSDTILATFGKPHSPTERGDDDEVDVRKAIEAILVEELRIPVTSPDMDLLDSGLLDSLALVDLIAAIERRFDIVVDMLALDLDDVRSVHAVARMVQANRPTPQ